MLLANAFNAEESSLVLHEGKVRKFENSHEQYLPFLTLQNRQAYENPSRSDELFSEFRNKKIIEQAKADYNFFGDIAYNYSPFVKSISKFFPEAKLVFLYRDCKEFVLSSASVRGDDRAPVGWPPLEKPLTRIEKFISLGRLQPKKDSEYFHIWDKWDHLEKNIWLWNETNSLILEQLKEIKNDVFYLSYEEFIKDIPENYKKLREFIGYKGKINSKIQSLLEKKINRRNHSEREKVSSWSDRHESFMQKTCSRTRFVLGYNRKL